MAARGRARRSCRPITASAMDVQVIGQQWEFTYRYPTYGGLETPHLYLPANTLIRLHVTSLDVIHSFWAVNLGVKADANPGTDNVVYVETKNPLKLNIRCAELCGLWHGYMFDEQGAWSRPQRSRPGSSSSRCSTGRSSRTSRRTRPPTPPSRPRAG